MTCSNNSVMFIELLLALAMMAGLLLGILIGAGKPAPKAKAEEHAMDDKMNEVWDGLVD